MNPHYSDNARRQRRCWILEGGNTLNDGRCLKQPAIYFVVVAVVLDTDTGMWMTSKVRRYLTPVYGGPDRT
jgi:hypothetical protein